jgi:hypothetical protein
MFLLTRVTAMFKFRTILTRRHAVVPCSNLTYHVFAVTIRHPTKQLFCLFSSKSSSLLQSVAESNSYSLRTDV